MRMAAAALWISACSCSLLLSLSFSGDERIASQLLAGEFGLPSYYVFICSKVLRY